MFSQWTSESRTSTSEPTSKERKSAKQARQGFFIDLGFHLFSKKKLFLEQEGQPSLLINSSEFSKTAIISTVVHKDHC